ncbi:hypothetical protein DFJ74DRAFT_700430 [Hyaloraphidium curvatum]|nr:hypothetical protein DFJ74DRAFT_700430 [Hyaloraphidium curvatum]
MPSTVLITGSNQGLGFHCADSLVRGGHRVILACRNVAAANEARDKISGSDAAVKECIVVLKEACDLSSLKSVREYAAVVISLLGKDGIKLDSLVLNAGLGGTPDYVVTDDGFDKIFESNHLGHFLLTLLLLPHLARNARIVSVSSEVHDPATKAPLPDPGKGFPAPGDADAWDKLVARGEPFPKDSAATNGSRRYSRSKLLNVFFANELARVLSGAVPAGVAADVAEASAKAASNRSCGLPDAATVTSVAMNPGLMLETGFFSKVAGGALAYLAYFLMPLLRLTPIGNLMRSASDSGAALARLAVDPKFAGISATFFNGDEKRPSSEFSRSMDGVTKLQVELWERSLGWAKVTPEERQKAML